MAGACHKLKASFDDVKCAENRSEDGVGDENGYRCANPVVDTEKTGRLELSNNCGAVLFVRHSRVQRRQNWKRDRKNKDRLHQTD